MEFLGHFRRTAKSVRTALSGNQLFQTSSRLNYFPVEVARWHSVCLRRPANAVWPSCYSTWDKPWTLSLQSQLPWPQMHRSLELKWSSTDTISSLVPCTENEAKYTEDCRQGQDKSLGRQGRQLTGYVISRRFHSEEQIYVPRNNRWCLWYLFALYIHQLPLQSLDNRLHYDLLAWKCNQLLEKEVSE